MKVSTLQQPTLPYFSFMVAVEIIDADVSKKRRRGRYDQLPAA